jgi:hypothetical protein
MSVVRGGRGLGEDLVECGGLRCHAYRLLGRPVECSSDVAFDAADRR